MGEAYQKASNPTSTDTLFSEVPPRDWREAFFRGITCVKEIRLEFVLWGVLKSAILISHTLVSAPYALCSGAMGPQSQRNDLGPAGFSITRSGRAQRSMLAARSFARRRRGSRWNGAPPSGELRPVLARSARSREHVQSAGGVLHSDDPAALSLWRRGTQHRFGECPRSSLSLLRSMR